MEHSTITISEFDAYAEHYQDELNHFCRRLVDKQDNYFVDLKCAVLHALLRDLGLDSKRLILADVGCGIGDFERRLALDFQQALALDLSWGMLQRAQRAIDLRGGGFICADSLALPLPDASVDVVFASCLLHHITFVEPQVVVQELRRICRPGGLVICFEHNPLNPITQLVVRTTPLDKSARLISGRALQQAFRQAGLADVVCRSILFGPKLVDQWLNRVGPFLQKTPLGAQYFVIGRRHAGI